MRRLLAALVGQEPLFDRHQKDHRELQALRAVQGHQRHPVVVRLVGVGVGHQARLFEECLEGALALRVLVELAGHGQQLLDVGQALLVLLVARAFVLVPVARLRQHVAQNLLHGGGRQGRQAVHQLGEDAQPSGRARAQALDAAGLARCLEQRQHVPRRVRGKSPQGRAAESPGRRVDHAEQGRVVARVVHQAQVGQDVLDLLALKKLQPVDQLVRNAVLAKGQLERPRQGVDPVEHHVVARPAPARGDLRGDPRGDCVGLVALVGVGDQSHGHALAVLGEQVLLLAVDVVRDQLGGDAEDPLRAAIVLLEPHHAHVGEVPLELEDVVQVGPAPAVDRLVRVAGDGQIRMVQGQGPAQQVLGEIGVLILVDEDVLVAVVERAADLRVLAEQRDRVQQQVVEIGRVCPRQLGLIGQIDLLDQGAKGVTGPRFVVLG